MAAKKVDQKNIEEDDIELGHLDVLKKLRIIIPAAQRYFSWIEKQCGVSGAQLEIMQELHEALRQLGTEQLSHLNQGLDELLNSIGILDKSYGLRPCHFTCNAEVPKAMRALPGLL